MKRMGSGTKAKCLIPHAGKLESTADKLGRDEVERRDVEGGNVEGVNKALGSKYTARWRIL